MDKVRVEVSEQDYLSLRLSGGPRLLLLRMTILAVAEKRHLVGTARYPTVRHQEWADTRSGIGRYQLLRWVSVLS